jgi:signal transduction histidine kinase
MPDLERRGERNARRPRKQERRDAREERRREHGARRRAERAADGPDAGEAEEPELAEESYEEAHRRARAKARFARDLLEYVVVVGVLALVLRPLAWIVGIIWGLGLASDFAKRVVEPALRQRWVEREVHRELRRTVPARRREIEGEHSRRIEELAAGVAHEIRNPVTAAKSLVQQMGEDPSSRENVDYAKVALEELNRVERSISHLLRFAREEEVRCEEMSIADVIASALESLRERVERSGTVVATAIDARGSMRGDAEKLRRVIINLVGNALDALAEARVPEPRLEIQAGENLAGSEVWVRVHDNGPGIGPERLRRIFSPFYTSKSEGTGLGLAISKKVVDAHGGSIEVSSEPGRGTGFLVTLPKSGTASEEERR